MSDPGEDLVDTMLYGEISAVGPEQLDSGWSQQRIPQDIPVPGDDDSSDWGAKLVNLKCWLNMLCALSRLWE